MKGKARIDLEFGQGLCSQKNVGLVRVSVRSPVTLLLATLDASVMPAVTLMHLLTAGNCTR